MPRITARQQRFLDQYALDFNAAAAALRAGYTAASANSVGSRQLALFVAHPEIRQLIRKEADALGLGRRAIVTGLLTEALGIGPDTRSLSRVRAWAALYPFTTGDVPDDAGDALADGDDGQEDGGSGVRIRFRASNGTLIDDSAMEGAAAAERGRNRLTARERRFLEEYRADFCTSRAARRAGYSAAYAEAKSHELLERLRDRPELADAEAARRAALSASIRRTLSGLLAEARGSRPATRSSTRVSAWLKLARFLGMAPGPIKPRPPEPPVIIFRDPEGNMTDGEGNRVDAGGNRVDEVPD